MDKPDFYCEPCREHHGWIGAAARSHALAKCGACGQRRRCYPRTELSRGAARIEAQNVARAAAARGELAKPNAKKDPKPKAKRAKPASDPT